MPGSDEQVVVTKLMCLPTLKSAQNMFELIVRSGGIFSIHSSLEVASFDVGPQMVECQQNLRLVDIATDFCLTVQRLIPQNKNDERS